MFRKIAISSALCAASISLWLAASASAQQVTLPLPRLLTITPMGGQAGTSVEATITADNLENVSALLFSTPKITAKPVIAADGSASETRFTVNIAPDAP